MRPAQAAIVGGGIIGCATAWQLTERGITDVVLFERARLASGATGVCPGGIRQQFETEADCRLAQRSVRFYERINERLEASTPFVFERSGYLFLADSADLMARFRRNVAMQNRLGIPSRLMTPDDIAALLPGARIDGLAGGSFCHEDGFLEDCDGVTNAFARVARSRGARVVYDEIRHLASAPGGWRLSTANETIDVQQVVVAAGVDTVALVSDVVGVPIVAERRRLAYTMPAPAGLTPPLVAALERGFAIKQLTNGVCYLGWLGDRPDVDDLTFIERSLESAATVFPLLHELPVRRIVGGIYDTTPDHRAILAEVASGLFIAAGFSGHGFMIAPAVGELMAGLVAGAPEDRLLGAFSLQRFSARAKDEGLQI